MKRSHVFVSGKVQGVCYRAETRRYAGVFNLNGWVRNLKDGRVECVFEGKAENVNKMLKWCKIGPDFSSVQEVKIVEEPFTGSFTDFSIRY
jgi:acylphosphatase